ncbi:MAG: rhomboid family intramembrane serine protease [Alphaproteobacteria bacterium]|nr:rhomboid family intramembrane serine protease [Alphaproteobacteria bacterium]
MSDDKNNDENDNVVEFKKPLKKHKPEEKHSAAKDQNNHPPLINLPPLTQYLLIAIVTIHVILTFLISDELANKIYLDWGFIPARFSGDLPFEPLFILSPLTHMLLHASWIHIAMNGVMFMAFGAGVERWLGAQKMLFILIISGFVGIAVQYILDPSSIYPVIGASGGLSGLFAAALIMINRLQGNANPYGIWPFIILWIVISVLFGMAGSPDGNSIAWAAHVGGFLGGFAALKMIKVI